MIRRLFRKLMGRQVTLTRKQSTERLANSLRAQGMVIGEEVGLVNVIFDTVYPFLIEVGSHSIITHATILAHDASPAVFSNRTRVGRVVIGDHVFIGAGAVVLPGVTIGSRSIVGANAVISRDVPENSIVAGNPARVVGKVDEWLARKESNDELIDWSGGTIPADEDVEKARIAAKQKFNIS